MEFEDIEIDNIITENREVKNSTIDHTTYQQDPNYEN